MITTTSTSANTNTNNTTNTINTNDDDDDKDQDTSSIFESSLAWLYDHAPVAHGSSGSSYTYHPPPPHQPLTLRLPSPPGALTSLQAHHLWAAGLFLAQRIFTQDVDVKGKTVVELGAGAGLVGISAGLMGCNRVVATDWDDEELLSALNENLERNPGSGERLVRGLRWGDRSGTLDVLSANQGNTFDVLLASDLLWYSSAHDPLLDSVFALLSPVNGTAHFASGLHSGRDPLQSFVQKLKERGGSVVEWKEVRWRLGGEGNENGEWMEYEPLENETEEQRRGVVVHFVAKIGG